MSPAPAPALVLFRDDLRVGDNPALSAAAGSGRAVVCLYVFDEESPGLRPLGSAARWWLHHALADLAGSLEALGGRLDILRGPVATIVPRLAAALGVGTAFWNRRYGAAERAADAALQLALEAAGVAVETFNGTLLHEPAEVRTRTGGPFKVYSPFLRAALALGSGGRPLPAPRRLEAGPAPSEAIALADLALLPTRPDWAGGLRATWTPGEAAAQHRLDLFLRGALGRYGAGRDRPGEAGTSGLSPYLRFGEISPRQILARVSHAAEAEGTAREGGGKFTGEVIWRDFAYNLLEQHPDLATRPMRREFEAFPFREDAAADIEAWRRGRTGYPIVDAGMRQLWRTGVMHNRVRMVAASFLVKHLLVDWRVGEAWFWDTLCDADPASNPVNWQWVAGCGVDAAPFFRVFNPTLQGEKFDPQGDYVRSFVPELAALPARWVHRPAEAPPAVLEAAGVRLGETYPRPIVAHEAARARALAALASLRDRSRAPQGEHCAGRRALICDREADMDAPFDPGYS